MTLKVYDLDRTLIWLPVDWEKLDHMLLEQFGAKHAYDLKGRQKTKAMDVARKAEIESVKNAVVNEKLCKQIIQEHAKGVKHAILSLNTRQAVELALEKAGIKQCFDLIVTIEDVENPKPDPEGLNKIMSELNQKPQDTQFYGDTNADEQAAKTAGVRFTRVKYGWEK